MKLNSKQLGDAGEEHAAALLQAQGYKVEKLSINAPTYDLRVSGRSAEFFVSVKVSRDKQHVRLGTRRAVLRLIPGNFVFAFMPKTPKTKLSSLDPTQYRLLILPAEMVRTDSLLVHDAYWSAKGGSRDFSVMVKGYGAHHKTIWPSWLTYENAWQLLPPPCRLTPPSSGSHFMDHVPTDSGIYVVSLTNETPISVNANRQSIAERSISVNRDNCKYGRAVNLARRKKEYQNTFGAENVVFKVVAVTSNGKTIEAKAGSLLGAHRIRGHTDKQNEWLQGITVAEVEQILMEVIKEVDSDSPSPPPAESTSLQKSCHASVDPLSHSPHSLEIQPADLLAAARYLQGAEMSVEYLRDLHHSPARRETFAGLVHYYSECGSLRDKNQLYGARLRYVADNHKQAAGSFESLVSEALKKYPK